MWKHDYQDFGHAENVEFKAVDQLFLVPKTSVSTQSQKQDCLRIRQSCFVYNVNNSAKW